jgi:hypothetical protein
MNTHEFSFGKIILVAEHIAEIIMNEGVQMDVAMVDACHRFLAENLRFPSGLLINKINSCSYDFEAQRKLGMLEQVRAVAIVSYRKTTELASQVVSAIVADAAPPREVEVSVKMFPERNEALQWLKTEPALQPEAIS